MSPGRGQSNQAETFLIDYLSLVCDAVRGVIESRIHWLE